MATLDTGRLFPSTYKLWEETEERYGRRIRSYHPDRGALAAYVARAGINGFYNSQAARAGLLRRSARSSRSTARWPAPTPG